MNMEQITIEQILKTWAKVRNEDEESFLMVSVRPKEESFTVVIWSKPIELAEEEDEEDDEEEGEGEKDQEEEERLQIGFHSTDKKLPNGKSTQESNVKDLREPLDFPEPDPEVEEFEV